MAIVAAKSSRSSGHSPTFSLAPLRSPPGPKDRENPLESAASSPIAGCSILTVSRERAQNSVKVASQGTGPPSNPGPTLRLPGETTGGWAVEKQGLCLRVGVLVSLALLKARDGRGQTTGSIAGRVVDGAGLPFTGVTVEATSPSLQGTRTAQTDTAGAFRFPGVPPGTYLVRGRMPSFLTTERTATVALGATATVDLVMQPSAEEQVVVSGEAPLIDGTSTTTGTSYSSNVIAHLPVARNYADIALANPGTDTDRGETQGRALALTVYGATSAENQWTIDGVNTTNVFKGTQGKVIHNEFVEAVEVKSGGYQAEFGRALGGIISAVTKSGGNAFHGDGFAYYDSVETAAHTQINAGDSVIAATHVVDGDRFEYGVDLGGFLVKDRLWFFGAYDGRSYPGPHLSCGVVV